ncbi:hypothetical protein OROGR_010501 [Orobanche gracilis]
MPFKFLNHRCSTIAEFIEQALSHEIMTKEIAKQTSSYVKKSKFQNQSEGGQSVFKKPSTGSSFSARPSFAPKPVESHSRVSNSAITCFNYGEQGHFSTQCPKQSVSCNNCGISGLKARFCRKDSRPSPTTSQAPGHSVVQNQTKSVSFKMIGANKGVRASDVGTSKPRIYEMKRTDDPGAKMISGTLEILSQPVCILFYIGASHYFISKSCLSRLRLDSATICEPYIIGLTDGTRIVGNREIQNCLIQLYSREWLSNLIVIDLPKEDVILGID